jgi:hypothetical protein
MIEKIAKYGLKTLKYGGRGVITTIPILSVPLIGSGYDFLGISALLQCSLVVKIPLILIWLQTVFAWTDDGLRKFGVYSN